MLAGLRKQKNKIYRCKKNKKKYAGCVVCPSTSTTVPVGDIKNQAFTWQELYQVQVLVPFTENNLQSKHFFCQLALSKNAPDRISRAT